MEMPSYVSINEPQLPSEHNDSPEQDAYDDPSMYQTASHGVHYYDPEPAYRAPPRYYTPTPEPYPRPQQMLTRSGRSLGSRPEETRSSRRTTSPRKRAPKKRAGKGAKNGPILDQPLSVLTKDYTVPVKDMHAWVNRSAEQRKKEADKKNGYISRPMNSFMMYRSAFADRCKKFCSENNHQVVSQVTGASWPMEPEHVRKEYEQLAIMERDNHAVAHPEYKFQPNKAGKKRGRETTDDEDSDGDWGSGRSKRSRTAGSSRRGETPRSHTSTPFDERMAYYAPHYQPAVPYQNPSSYAYQYPERRPPAMYQDPAMMPHHYYQSNIVQYGPGVEDVQFQPVEMRFPPQDESLSLVGLPDSHVLASTNAAPVPVMSEVDMLDPRLGDQLSPGTRYQLQQLQDYEYPHQTPMTATFHQAYHPGQVTLTEGALMEPGADFERELSQFG